MDPEVILGLLISRYAICTFYFPHIHVRSKSIRVWGGDVTMTKSDRRKTKDAYFLASWIVKKTYPHADDRAFVFGSDDITPVSPMGASPGECMTFDRRRLQNT